MTSKEVASLDRLAKKITQSRPGPCEKCLEYRAFYDTAHIISRKIRVTRWMQPNLLKICQTCHRKFHDRPTFFADWVVKNKGQGVVDTLNRLSLIPWPEVNMSKEEIQMLASASLDTWLIALRKRGINIDNS